MIDQNHVPAMFPGQGVKLGARYGVVKLIPQVRIKLSNTEYRIMPDYANITVTMSDGPDVVVRREALEAAAMPEHELISLRQKWGYIEQEAASV